MLKSVSRIIGMLLGVALVLAGCNLRTANSPTNTPLPTPDIPRVRFIFPDNNSNVLEGTDLAVEILAEDSGTGIAKVQLVVDEVLQGEGKPEIAPSVPAFSAKIHWVATGVGMHSLAAIAYRADGTGSDTVNLVVSVIPRPTASPS